jgi:hypothetical protein
MVLNRGKEIMPPTEVFVARADSAASVVATWHLALFGAILVLIIIALRLFGIRRPKTAKIDLRPDAQSRDVESIGDVPGEDDKPSSRPWRIFADYPIVIAIFAALALVVGLSLKENGWQYIAFNQEFLANFFLEVGTALLIAFFIAISIEKYSRETHNAHVQAQIDKIKRSVFESIYKNRYDKHFVNFIEDNIFKYPLYRRKYRVGIKIEEHPSVAHKKVLSAEDPVILNITLRSTVVNISSKSIDRVMTTFIEKPDLDYPDHQPRLCVFTKGHETHNFANDEEFKKVGQLQDREDMKIYSVNVHFQPEEKIHIELQYTLVKFARDEMSWRCIDPAEDFLLAMNHTKKLCSFATAMHSRGDIKPRRQIGAFDLELEIPEPLFPHNGAVVWWRPKKPSLSPQAGIAPDSQGEFNMPEEL